MSGRGLKRQINLIEEFRDYDACVGIQTVFAFLVIVHRVYYRAETMRVMDVGIEMDTTSASASRNMAWLVKHKLIELYENPDKRIEKFIKLTKQGQKLVKRLELIE